jgi:hypothetical protein
LYAFILEKGIRVLFIDTLSKFWTVLDENDNAEVQRAVNPLLALARDLNVAVVLVHHSNKGDGGGGRMIRGASSLFGIVDQALILHRHGPTDSTQRRLETLGRYEESPRDIIVTLDGDVYKLLGDVSDVKLGSIKANVKLLLGNNEAMTAAELAQDLGLKSIQVQKALNPLPAWLLRKGNGHKNDPYVYALAPHGGAKKLPLNLLDSEDIDG